MTRDEAEETLKTMWKLRTVGEMIPWIEAGGKSLISWTKGDTNAPLDLNLYLEVRKIPS